MNKEKQKLPHEKNKEGATRRNASVLLLCYDLHRCAVCHHFCCTLSEIAQELLFFYSLKKKMIMQGMRCDDHDTRGELFIYLFSNFCVASSILDG